MNTHKILKEAGLYMGRMLSFSKSEYRQANPDNVVYFNANIVSVTDGKVWYGDLDLTKDADAIKTAASELGEPLFILKELDCRFEDEGKGGSELIKKAIWNTTEEIPVK